MHVIVCIIRIYSFIILILLWKCYDCVSSLILFNSTLTTIAFSFALIYKNRNSKQKRMKIFIIFNIHSHTSTFSTFVVWLITKTKKNWCKKFIVIVNCGSVKYTHINSHTYIEEIPNEIGEGVKSVLSNNDNKKITYVITKQLIHCTLADTGSRHNGERRNNYNTDRQFTTQRIIYHLIVIDWSEICYLLWFFFVRCYTKFLLFHFLNVFLHTLCKTVCEWCVCVWHALNFRYITKLLLLLRAPCCLLLLLWKTIVFCCFCFCWLTTQLASEQLTNNNKWLNTERRSFVVGCFESLTMSNIFQRSFLFPFFVKLFFAL